MVNTGAHTRMPHSAGKGAKQGRATATRDEAAATGRPGKHTSVDVALPLSTPPDAWTPTALSTRSRTLSAANARNRANPICLDSDDNDMPDTAFGVQHAAAVKALRDSGAPVNYGSVIRESMRSTLYHGPPAPYDRSKDTPADHARESYLRSLRMKKILAEMYPTLDA